MMTANSERIQKFLQEIAHGPRPASTLRVWIALYPYIDPKTGRIQCSQRALAKTSNVHFGDVNRSLKRLVNIGTLVKKDKGAYFLSPSVLDENGIYDRGFKWP
jgi:hypothetical protein